MPLTRATVTTASRIMLPAHAAFDALLGLVWLLQDPARTKVGALEALRHLWPIQDTGLILLVVAGIEIAALLTHRREVGGIALFMGAAVYMIFAGLDVASLHLHLVHGHLDPGNARASISAPLWPLYVAVCHVASAVSLAFYDQPRNGGRA